MTWELALLGIVVVCWGAAVLWALALSRAGRDR
jgi:hypothetical protein